MLNVTGVLFAILYTLITSVFICKGKGHPRTGREGQKGELTNSSTFSLTSIVGGGGWSTPRTSRFTPGKTRYALYKRLGGPQGRSGRVLYRPNYRGPCSFVTKLIIYVTCQSYKILYIYFFGNLLHALSNILLKLIDQNEIFISIALPFL